MKGREVIFRQSMENKKTSTKIYSWKKVLGFGNTTRMLSPKIGKEFTVSWDFLISGSSQIIQVFSCLLLSVL